MASTIMVSHKGIMPLLLIMTMLLPQLTNAQICDDFGDGTLHSDPTWTGDTADFRVNSNRQLQLYSGGAGTSQIALPYSMPASDTIEWRFWLRLGFTPTAGNYTVVALFADSADLFAASHYLSVAVTDPESGDKNISLFQDGTPIYTFPYKPKLSSNSLRFRIRLVDHQQLHLAIDTTGTADFNECGTAALLHNTLPDEAYFCIFCKYTSSRAHLFYYDDIGVNADECNGGGTTNKPQKGNLVINEVLFNPESGGADYVEIYNRSGIALSLSEIYLATTDGEKATKLFPIAASGEIEPNSYIVVTTDAGFVTTHYTVPNPSHLIDVPSMPAYSDNRGSVAIATSDSTILDHFEYSVQMHSHLLRDVEGVALERRSTDRPTQDPTNWYSAASTSGYGTPTARNSQSHEVLFVDNDFATSNSVFSPDGDGYNDLLDISYNLELCDLAANINIYDRQGRLVKDLLRGELLGCDGILVWDGTDKNGQSCPRGNYLIIVEAYNQHGAKQNWRRVVSLVRQ